MIYIDELNEQKEWVRFKKIGWLNSKKNWDKAVKEVIELNGESEGKYRAVGICGPLTCIYCSGLYVVPTVRFY